MDNSKIIKQVEKIIQSKIFKARQHTYEALKDLGIEGQVEILKCVDYYVDDHHSFNTFQFYNYYLMIFRFNQKDVIYKMLNKDNQRFANPFTYKGDSGFDYLVDTEQALKQENLKKLYDNHDRLLEAMALDNPEIFEWNQIKKEQKIEKIQKKKSFCQRLFKK